MSHYKPRYGIPGSEVENLAKRKNAIEGGENWDSFDDWVRWCSENGYQKGIALRRYDPDKPHSPENSFFGEPAKEIIKKRKQKKQETKEIQSPFCEKCEKECPGNGSVGCYEWQEYFINNWNQEFYVAPPEPEKKVDPDKPMIFRYEHPDLVREGILFESSCSM